MKQSFVIVALLTVLVAATSTSARQAGASVTDRTMPNFSGTYVDGLQPASCAVALKISPGRALTLYVAHVSNKMSLRVAPSGAFRVVPIERRGSALRRSTRRNGLARWEGDALVVETSAPSFPLLGGHHAEVHGGTLTESFARTVDGLVYRASYGSADDEGPHEPFEIRLLKCQGRASL